MDPQHRILLELAHEALENAGMTRIAIQDASACSPDPP